MRQAIESLVRWKAPEGRPYDYHRDPRLDRVDDSSPGIWRFDQPWPEYVNHVVVECAEVVFNPTDMLNTYQSRQALLGQTYRRVTVARNGEVEGMDVTGHWWDFRRPYESKVGMLSRSVVRKLNSVVTAKRFAARINSIQKCIVQDREFLELYIDLAIDETPEKKSQTRVHSR